MVAIVIGATGLVGQELVKQLLHHDRFTGVVVLARKATHLAHPKLKWKVIDFEHLNSYTQEMYGDVLFSCLGTTIKKAGSKNRQWRIDHDYQYETALLANRQGVNKYVLVSSMGANPKSKVFYNRMKGQLEQDVMMLPFSKIDIMRPSILEGDRLEFRFGEKVGLGLMHLFNRFSMFNKYRPVKASAVARAMIDVCLNEHSGCSIHFSEEIQKANWN